MSFDASAFQVQFEDEAATQAAKQEAADSVEAVYVYDTIAVRALADASAHGTRREDAEQLFGRLQQLGALGHVVEERRPGDEE